MGCDGVRTTSAWALPGETLPGAGWAIAGLLEKRD